MIFVNPDSKTNRDIPNIGLALAATHYNARIIDLNTLPSEAARYLDFKTDLLGISVQSRTYHQALAIREDYLRKYPGSTVKSVTGFLDVQCCYPYLSFDDDLNPGIPFGDSMPIPDYGLFDSIGVFKGNWQRGKWRYAIITTLGCPFGCTYCSASRRRIEERSVAHVIEELQEAKRRWDIRSFMILDDCFNAKRQRVLDFCEQVRPLGLKWGCANGLRADRFDEEIAVALRGSGCDFISFGVESANDDILLEIHKGESLSQIEQAVEVALRHFGVVNGYFILGLPGSTYEKDLASLRWVLRHGMNGHFSYYVPGDETLSPDAIFYGESARPLSDAYDKQQQREIYERTTYMRAGYRGGTLNKALAWLLTYLRYSPMMLPADILRRIMRRLRGL